MNTSNTTVYLTENREKAVAVLNVLISIYPHTGRFEVTTSDEHLLFELKLHTSWIDHLILEKFQEIRKSAYVAATMYKYMKGLGYGS